MALEKKFSYFDAEHFHMADWSSLGLHVGSFNIHQLLRLLAASTTFILIHYMLFSRGKQSHDETFTANKRFPYEPSLFARIRWSHWARKLLEDADKKAHGHAYKLARGDKELVVLPTRLIPELNKLGTDVINSRQSHAFTLLGNLTGMQVVEKTSYHVRMLLGRISPALPELLAPTAARITASMEQNFPQSDKWTAIKPLPATVICFSEGIALALFGAKMSENPRLVQLTYELTKNVFTVAFAMRCVPSCLQPALVWFLPAKWSLHRGWQELSSFVVPEVLRQKEAETDCNDTANHDEIKEEDTSPDLISWMVKDGKTELERDPDVLTTLCGSVAAGSTYSIANFVCRTLSDLTAHPDVLDAIRSELRDKHVCLSGRKWNFNDLQSGLDCLESAMKETARLAPGTLIVYSRVVQRDYVFDKGGHEISLKRGQFITMSGMSRAKDPAIFEGPELYRGLRFCPENDTDKLEDHRSKPFRSVDPDILAWGSGRWACPGRLVADMAAKIVLIQLLDKYEFAFVDGKPLKPSCIHEFLFFHPDNKMLVRRRQDSIGIEF